MDFLNNSFAQIKDLFQGMTPGSRILAGLLLVVVVVSMGYLVKSGVTTSDEYLLDGAILTNYEIQAAHTAFGIAGLNDAETDGLRIKVPRSQRDLYLTALADNEALPQNMDKIIDNAIKGVDSWASVKMSEATLNAAHDVKVGKMIESRSEIQRAIVDCNSAPIDKGWRRTSRTTVTVTVTPVGSKILSREDVQPIFHMIKSCYAAVELPGITVMLTNAGAFVGSEEDDPSNGGGHFAKMKEYEKYKEEKIRELLNTFPQAEVVVTAELDTKTRHVTSTITPDAETSTPLSTSESMSETSTTTGSPGGNPGLQPQGGVNGQAILTTVAAGESEDTTSDSESQTDFLAGGETASSEFAGLTPTRLTVSITIPDSYLESVWRKANPDVEGEEPKTPDSKELDTIETETIGKIEGLVKPQLRTGYDGSGIATVEDSVVVVEFFTSLPSEPLPEPGMVQGATGWLAQSWQTLGMFALAMFSMLMLRSMVKIAPSAESVKASSKVEKEEEEEEIDPVEEAKKVASRALKPFGESGASLKDELSDLVSGDPDAAANILRNWIGTTANVK